MYRTSVHRPRRAALSVVLGALVLALLPGGQAQADPTVAQIEAQITKIWNEAEPLIEKYNEVHEQYKKNKAKQAQLQKQIAPLQRDLDFGQARIGALASAIYKGNRADALNAVLTSGSPAELAEQLAYLEVIARDQERELSGVTALKADFDAKKAPIDALVAQLAQQDTDLAAQRKAIETKLNQLQKLRLQAYGSSGGTGSFRPWPCPSEYLPMPGYKAAKFACSQAGKPYVWAASGPNAYDCSGLTLRAWAQVGVYL
ncbi:MAG TPA: hypothetical protein VF163_22080, partial [Micromonosporaceae bacterium]